MMTHRMHEMLMVRLDLSGYSASSRSTESGGIEGLVSQNQDLGPVPWSTTNLRSSTRVDFYSECRGNQTALWVLHICSGA
ncbi:hypothetical protein Y032_0953g3190 [Ancylostoma ceylanicum]|nr:hypothetical protein Y032_0953g3190 [Ancylostoma ceylanicum]